LETDVYRLRQARLRHLILLGEEAITEATAMEIIMVEEVPVIVVV
jgi:hypothetical protein